LIIAHQSVLRCIYAYIMDISMENIPFLEIPWDTVLEFVPAAYGCKEKRYDVLAGLMA
jgi:6-phosphofructo-2-kinase/fructose-2,6-biphosphatase 4